MVAIHQPGANSLNWTPSAVYPGLTDNVVIRSFGLCRIAGEVYTSDDILSGIDLSELAERIYFYNNKFK